MCAVSAVIHTAQQQFPPINQWPLQQLVGFQDIIRKLDEIDKKMGAKDCYEPTKADFLKALEERVNQLERRVDQHLAP